MIIGLVHSYIMLHACKEKNFHSDKVEHSNSAYLVPEFVHERT